MLPFVGTIDGLMSTADFGGSGAWQDDEDDDCAKVPVVARTDVARMKKPRSAGLLLRQSGHRHFIRFGSHSENAGT